MCTLQGNLCVPQKETDVSLKGKLMRASKENLCAPKTKRETYMSLKGKLICTSKGNLCAPTVKGKLM